MAEVAAGETEIGPERAVELIDAGACLVDVRRGSEWEAGRIEGARRIEINDLTAAAESIPRDRPLVLCCRSGSRSALAAAAFREAGWEAYNLAGGLVAWVEAKMPLDPPDGRVASPSPGA